MDYATRFLGQTVNIIIDRPFGEPHPKWGYTYPLNYGYVPGTCAPDGSEVDAYLLGIDYAVSAYTGLCIAVIHRRDDDDDKLVVVAKGESYTDDEIRAATLFQEKFFMSNIIHL